MDYGPVVRRLTAALLTVVLTITALAGCSATDRPAAWIDEEVTFEADGLTLHGTYRHRDGGSAGSEAGPAALLISESGRTDRNGDNNVAGPIGNMRQLAEYLSDHGVASLRYDKVGTGATGLGRYAAAPADVGRAVYTGGAKSAIRFLAGQAGTDAGRISVYAVGEGAIHAMSLAGDTSAGAPSIHSLGLLQPLAARYLDLISSRVSADLAAAVRDGAKSQQQADQVLGAWRSAVQQARAAGTAPAALPDGLTAILNPGNAKAVADADAIDPLSLAARIPAGTPVMLTCSDSDGQADCADMTALRGALAHTALQFVELTGVNHVLREDASDNIGNYAKQDPLAPQLIAALDQFVIK